jgi:hypothetical protein
VIAKVQVKLNERVVLFKNSLPFRALGPGGIPFAAVTSPSSAST